MCLIKHTSRLLLRQSKQARNCKRRRRLFLVIMCLWAACSMNAPVMVELNEGEHDPLVVRDRLYGGLLQCTSSATKVMCTTLC